jgi:hypothetical protein
MKQNTQDKYEEINSIPNMKKRLDVLHATMKQYAEEHGEFYLYGYGSLIHTNEDLYTASVQIGDLPGYQRDFTLIHPRWSGVGGEKVLEDQNSVGSPGVVLTAKKDDENVMTGGVLTVKKENFEKSFRAFVKRELCVTYDELSDDFEDPEITLEAPVPTDKTKFTHYEMVIKEATLKNGSKVPTLAVLGNPEYTLDLSNDRNIYSKEQLSENPNLPEDLSLTEKAWFIVSGNAGMHQQENYTKNHSTHEYFWMAYDNFKQIFEDNNIEDTYLDELADEVRAVKEVYDYVTPKLSQEEYDVAKDDGSELGDEAKKRFKTLFQPDVDKRGAFTPYIKGKQINAVREFAENGIKVVQKPFEEQLAANVSEVDKVPEHSKSNLQHRLMDEGLLNHMNNSNLSR